MGKKQQRVTLEEAVNQPWCYYCDRTFVDMKVLQDHQKQMHFQCQTCRRRLNTIGGLKVHSEQVHKEHISKVQNCGVEGRDNPDVEVFCMEGIPTDIMEARRAAITHEYHKRENEWRMKTGNPISGPNPNEGKRKAEEQNTDTRSPAERVRELKRRKMEERAAKQAQEAQQAQQNGSAAVDTPAHFTPSAVPHNGASYAPGTVPATVPSPLPPSITPNLPPPPQTGSLTPNLPLPTTDSPLPGPIEARGSETNAERSTEEKLAIWHSLRPFNPPLSTVWLREAGGIGNAA